MSDENNDGIDDDEVNANAQVEAQDRLRNGVIQAYRDLLGREPENESVVNGWMRHPHGLPGIRGAIASGPEYSLPETVARRQRASQAPTTPPSQRVPLAGGLEEEYTRQLAGGLQHRSGDLPAARVVDENKAAWEAELREAARVAGLPYDPGTLEGLIRQVTYARNAGTHSSHFLAQAKANYAERANNLTSPTPSPTPSPAPSPAPRPTTLAAVVPPPAAVTQPYSARMTSPVTTALPVAAAPSSVPVSEAGMPTARQTATMGNMLSSSSPYVGQNPYAFQAAQGVRGQNPYAFQVPQAQQQQDAENPYAADRQFGYTNDVYNRSLQGTGFARAPWAGTRDQLSRGPMAPSPMDASTGMPNNRDRRRAYQFGAQDAANNQRDAMLGQQDFNGQMNNWLKAYNDWNRRGADPFAPPTGGV